jgi:F420-dependent oxidoreductase-like protein
MQFGIQIEPMLGFRFDEVREIARAAESSGFTGLWLSDHLFLNNDSADLNCFESWTLLAALSQHTTTLRLGTMVTSVSYRNPALLAKIAAGVDVMSGGRIEFGIGAGWKEPEYRAYGYEFPPDSVRIEQLVDAIEICRRLWTEPKATYRGKHHSVENAPCAPKPVQRPLPVWIGGKKPRLLRIMAKYADAVNVGGFPTLETYTAAMRTLEEACRAIGRDPRQIRRSHFVPTVIADTRRELDAIVDEIAADAKMNMEAWRESRQSWMIGTPDEIAERLRGFARAGCSYFLPFFLPHGRETEMLRLFADTVMPALA